MRGGSGRNRGSGTGGVRAFFALEIPETIKQRLRDELGALRAELDPARWVRPAGFHLTLKFLGESPPRALDELAGSLGPRLEALDAVEVRLSGSGFFPGPGRPRVAWVGGEAPGAAEVASVIDSVAASAGWQRERRPYSLHLTVARLQRPWSPSSVERWLEWGKGFAAEPFSCGEVILFESRLGPGGAEYTPRAQLPLRGTGG